MTPQYTSIDRIFAKVQRDYAVDIQENDMIEWTGEALEAIGTIKLYQENVAFIEVSNYQCELPDFFHGIIQIAKDNEFDASQRSSTGLCPKQIVEAFQGCNPTPGRPLTVDNGQRDNTGTFDPDTVYNPVNICPDGSPGVDYDLAYYRPFFDMQWQFPQWQQSGLYNNRFTPVRLATSSLFTALVCHPDNSMFTNQWRDEYTIIDNGAGLRFNFQTGMIALSYLKQRVDEETGYPLVPDDEAITEAIGSYIMKKMMTRDFYGRREGSQNLMMKAESDWQWHCRRAKTKIMMPNIDELQNLLDQRNYLIPRTNRYHGFFGKLNIEERSNFRSLIQRQTHYSVVK
jgi:hypothetical protein